MKWWVIEDALRDTNGHWCEYIETFQEGLIECGDSLEIFCAGDATADTQSHFNAKAELPPSIWARMGDAAPKWQRFFRVFSHGNATHKSVKGLLNTANPAPDVLFVPTVLVHHLWGWWRLLNGPLKAHPAKVLLFFPNTPVFIDSNGAPKLNSDPTATLFKWLIRRLKKHVQSGKLILGAETHSMVEALTQVTGVIFNYLPHPVRLKEPSSTYTKPNRASLKSETTNNKQQTVITLGAYGSARFEKGSELIQLAAKQILKSKPDVPVEFCLQWLGDFENETGQLQAKDPDLEKHPKFNYITQLFKGNDYHQQLAKTHIMLLPYRDAYQLRVSRVVIEAMLYGLPVIASENTTLWEQAERYGAGLPCKIDPDTKSLSESIVCAVDMYPQLRQRARQQMRIAAAHFSVKEFRKLLLKQFSNDG